MNAPSVQRRNVILPKDLDDIRRLWVEYLIWGNEKMKSIYGVHPHNPIDQVEQDIKQIEKFQPPHGQLVVALSKDTVCGVGSLKKISAEIGEIKRMYVDPNFRGIGAGGAILEGLLLEARKVGYRRIRLDSPRFMEAAHSLYRKIGFCDIDPYPEMEISEEFVDYLYFMELELS